MLQRRFLHPMLATCLIVVGVLVGFRLNDNMDGTAGYAYRDKINKLEEVITYLNQNYFREVDNEKLVEDAIKGMLKKLDPHTFYIPAKELKSINEQMSGSFEGIGIEFNIVDDTLYVVTPISGGPSEQVGIQAGDRIIKIDGEDFSGTGISNNDVVKRLRGEKGTRVRLHIGRQGADDLLEFEIVRDKIPIHSIDYSYMIDQETGYIKVNRFSGTTFREFAEHLNRLQNQGLKNLILDLRNNPGGYLDQAYYLTDLFLGGNRMIVYTEGRIESSKKEYHATDQINQFEQGGLVVLINEGSASASEIVSGAVQDWDRGLIVGTRSFGKGLVQSQHLLSDESAVRIVISRYFTPSGRCIQKPFSNDDDDYDREIVERYESGEIFDPEQIEWPDSLKYQTDAGRTVYGGGGIMPDVYLPPDTTQNSDYLTQLFVKNVFNDFALKYADQHKTVAANYSDGRDFARRYSIEKEVINAFTDFAEEHGVPFDRKGFKTSEEHIHRRIKSLLGRAWFNDDGFYPVWHQGDQVFNRALELMPKAIKLSQTGKFSPR